jgi:thiamine biosynthesis protein ThiS
MRQLLCSPDKPGLFLFGKKMDILKINGVEKKFPAGLPENLSGLLKELGLNAETVVAEVNGQIIERRNFAQTKLKAGQSIELVRFVPGG